LRDRWVLDKGFAKSEIMIEEDPGTGGREETGRASKDLGERSEL